MKKLTKLTALALALALLLGMTAMAADTEVYYYEDFSDYDIETYKTTLYATTGTTSGGEPTAAVLTDANTYQLTLSPITPVVATGANYDRAAWMAFETNAFGSKALKAFSVDSVDPWAKTATSGIGLNNVGTKTFYIKTAKAWDYTANTDETYVVTYELDGDPTLQPIAEKNMRFAGTVWSNANEDAFQIKQEFKGETTAPETSTNTEDTATNPNADLDIDKSNCVTTFEAVKNKWDSQTWPLTVVPGEAYRIGYGTTYKADQDWPTRIYALDGGAFSAKADPEDLSSLDNNLQNTNIDHTTYNKIVGYYFSASTRNTFGYANIKIYTIKNGSFKAQADVAGAINPETTKTVRVKFANPVAPATFSKNVVVKANDSVVSSGYTIGDLQLHADAVGGEIYSYVDVTFDNIAYASTYTIDFADEIANEIGTQLGETASVATFSTIDAPTFAMTLTAYKGLNASGTALEALEAGTTYFTVSATHDSGAAVTNGTVKIEILDADGNVVKYATAKKALGSTAATFGAAFKLEAGQTAKAYVVGTEGVATID